MKYDLALEAVDLTIKNAIKLGEEESEFTELDRMSPQEVVRWGRELVEHIEQPGIQISGNTRLYKLLLTQVLQQLKNDTLPKVAGDTNMTTAVLDLIHLINQTLSLYQQIGRKVAQR